MQHLLKLRVWEEKVISHISFKETFFWLFWKQLHKEDLICLIIFKSWVTVVELPSFALRINKNRI